MPRFLVTALEINFKEAEAFVGNVKSTNTALFCGYSVNGEFVISASLSAPASVSRAAFFAAARFVFFSALRLSRSLRSKL